MKFQPSQSLSQQPRWDSLLKQRTNRVKEQREKNVEIHCCSHRSNMGETKSKTGDRQERERASLRPIFRLPDQAVTWKIHQIMWGPISKYFLVAPNTGQDRGLGSFQARTVTFARSKASSHGSVYSWPLSHAFRPARLMGTR